jgi:Fe-S-cluster containining protein
MSLPKNMNFRLENGKRVYYQFECFHCGDCCRFLDILLEKNDILKWIAEARDFLQYIQIQPESASADLFIKAEMEGKLEVLKKFILEKHQRSSGENLQRDSLSFAHLFLPELPSNCILSPQTYQIVLEGLDLGIKYMLLSKKNGDCVFFTGQGCAIYEIKPAICTKFPFESDGTLVVNDWTLRLCKGIKRIERIK